MTDISSVVNAYFVRSMRAMSTLAAAIGKPADAAIFSAQANATTTAIQRLMMDATTGLFTDTLTSAGNVHSAWHSQVFPMWAGPSHVPSCVRYMSMWAGVAPADAWPGLIKFLHQKSVGTGVTGSVYAAYSYFLALYEADGDHGNFALEMLTSCEKNSYCHMLLQGATATMEVSSCDALSNC